jgi:HK97 family phage prohead protease
MSIAAFQKRVFGIHHQRIAWSAKDIALIAAFYGVSKFNLPELPAMKRRAPDLTLRSASPDGRTFHFVASDGSVDRMKDVIDPSGWQLSAYKKNPIVLFAHDSGSLPVGKAVSVSVQDKKLVASFRFASTGLGKAVANLIGGGFLNAVSVGFAPIKFSFSTDPTRKGGIDFASAELLEISVVPVPANPRALLTGITGGDGKSLDVNAPAKRQRDVEIAKLRCAPLTVRERRAADVARLRAKA